MTFLALIAIIFFGFAVYNLTCAFVDIPTKKTSQMMMLSRKQQGTKNEKLLDVYVTKIAGWIAPYLRLDRLKRNKVQRALDIAGLQLTPEVDTARAWVTAGAVGLCAIPMALLIPLLENAAAGILQQYLEEGKGSVGTHLNVSHDAPTPVGMKVWAEAEITAVSENGKMIDLAVKAWDEKGPIGAGTHTRAIITNDRFLSKCNSKLEK